MYSLLDGRNSLPDAICVIPYQLKCRLKLLHNGLKLLEEKILIFLYVVLKLNLVLAELFGTVLAAKRLVCALGKTLGMALVGDFPSEKNNERNEKKAIRIDAGNHQKRSANHCKIPIVNTAGGAAAILHKPGLEWAEEKDADNITNTVCQRYENKNVFIHRIGENKMKGEDGAVQGKPCQSYGQCSPCRLVLRLAGYLWRLVIFGKDLLASHALKLAGEQAADHLCKIP